MKILAIEAATEACSVALYMNGEVIDDHRVAPREHTHLLLPMIESLLSDAGITRNALDGVAFGRGPGAFTGVRIAARRLAVTAAAPCVSTRPAGS